MNSATKDASSGKELSVNVPVLLMLTVQPSGRLLFCAFNDKDEQIAMLQAGDWKITKGKLGAEMLEISRPFPTEIIEELAALEHPESMAKIREAVEALPTKRYGEIGVPDTFWVRRDAVLAILAAKTKEEGEP